MNISKTVNCFLIGLIFLGWAFYSCASGNVQKKQAFEDSAEFKLYMKGTVIASVSCSLDKKGNY
jgi:hypothetical protein